MPIDPNNVPPVNLNSYDIAGPPVRKNINEELEPPVRDVHSILAERADRKLHNDIASARAKAWLLQEARDMARQQIEAEQAQAAREAYYAEMRPRLISRGISTYAVERVLGEMYEEEVRTRIREQDAAAKAGVGLAARYAL